MINFPFGTNGKLIIVGVPILKHITVLYITENSLVSFPVFFTFQHLLSQTTDISK